MNDQLDNRGRIRLESGASGWELLTERVDAIARLDQADKITQCALDAAVRLSSVRSAMLVSRRTAGDAAAAAVAIGPLAVQLRRLAAGAVAELAGLVNGSSCSHVVDQPTQYLAGVTTVVVVALTAHGEQLGVMVLADDDPGRDVPPAPVLAQLEVLGVVVAGAWEHALDAERLVELARRDPLTGLGHARAFSTRLAELRAAGVRHAVLSIDVDHFKRVNDDQGHDAGDRALCAVGEAMNTALRLNDCLYRTGGDEFAVAVPVRDESDALGIADRIQRAARRAGLPVSIGVAVVSPDDADVDDAFARADAALYGVKRRGRDGTALAHPDQPVRVTARVPRSEQPGQP